MFPNDRPQTLGEEIANTISHGLGAAGALAAAPILIIAAARQGDAAFIAGAAVFAASMCLLYLASTIYHALPENRAKRLFNVLDHSAIYLLIAGTYTPFALGALRGPWGWTLFGIVWGLAVIGILQEIKPRSEARILSIVIYAVMGWIVLVAVKPLLHSLGSAGFAWLAAGGVFYTVGIIFFAFDSRFRHWHGIWHLFVIAGSLMHFVAVSFYVR